MQTHAASRLRIALSLAAAALLASTGITAALAQDYPVRPVHLLVGLPAGGGADAVARILAAKLSENLRRQVVVENRPGSGGLIAAEAVAKSVPDGYTVLFGTVSSSAIFASLYKKLPYDPVKDFAPVTLIATYPLVLVVGANFPARSIAELIAYAKAHPGALSYASAGSGSPLHLAMEIFKTRTGIQAAHVPYKGGVQAVSDLMRGEIHLIFDAMPTQIANIKSGKVRALAIASKARSQQLPDVPTMLEAGVPDLQLSGWFAAFTQKDVPSQAVIKLNASIVDALASHDTRQRFAELGVEAAPSTSAELAAFQRSEIDRWARAVKESGATAD